MPKRRSRIRKKSVKKSRKRRDNRGKIRNPKSGRYVKKSGVIGKKLLAKSRKKKSRKRRLKSTKKRRSPRLGRSRGQSGDAAPKHKPVPKPKWLIDDEYIFPSAEQLFKYCTSGDGSGPNCDHNAEHIFNQYPPTTETEFNSWWEGKTDENKKKFIKALRKNYLYYVHRR